MVRGEVKGHSSSVGEDKLNAAVADEYINSMAIYILGFYIDSPSVFDMDILIIPFFFSNPND